VIKGTMRYEERQREIFFFHLEEERLWGSLNAAISYLVGREGIEKVLPRLLRNS